MLSRRVFVAALVVAAVLPASAAESDDPSAVVAAAYKRIAQSKKRKTQDFWQKPEERPSAFTAALVKLWAKAEAKASSDGDGGPVDFDLFYNMQDDGVVAPTFTTVDNDGVAAHVRVQLRPAKAGKEPSADEVLVFSLKHEAAGWRIDDLHGSASGDPWSLRGILTLQ